VSEPKKYIAADAFLRDSWRLASAVRDSGWKPDFLIALWRGGAAAGVAVHEFLKASGWDMRHLPLKCASYSGIGKTTGRVDFTLGDETFSLVKPGERVLVVDDVYDTGATASAVRERLGAAGAEARVACVYWKSGVPSAAGRPDYFAVDAGSSWIVFPHEIDGLTAGELREKDAELADMMGECIH
jgi:hypothetical protein